MQITSIELTGLLLTAIWTIALIVDCIYYKGKVIQKVLGIILAILLAIWFAAIKVIKSVHRFGYWLGIRKYQKLRLVDLELGGCIADVYGRFVPQFEEKLLVPINGIDNLYTVHNVQQVFRKDGKLKLVLVYVQ